MRSILLTFFASMLLCTGVALASPTKLAQQGRVLDSEGLPFEGEHVRYIMKL